MKILASLSNRIFLATALVAVLSIGVAIYNVNAAVTDRAEQELRRDLDEAGTLVDEYRRLLFEHFSREARLVADLPRLKAAVETGDPPTVQPLAAEYHQQLDAALVLITDPAHRVLGEVASGPIAGSTADLPAIREAALGREASSFRPHAGGILQVVSVPIWIDPRQPEILGTLSVGLSLDNAAAEQFRALTDSEVAFAMDGRVHASTLPRELWSGVEALLVRDGLWPAVPLGAEDYVAVTRPLAGPGRATAVLLRSRTERLRFLGGLHRTLGITAVVAVLAATLLSYGIARTVTRPLGAITATMREMASTGDLNRRIEEPSPRGWQDEDARVLATTFNRLTESIDRFQREAAQRERLSSLGRLSTVIAHEIRNPLMIIKVALRSLRQNDVSPEQVEAAVADIDEEVTRLNRIVTEVLDFARPVKFELGPADLNALCADAAGATLSEPPPVAFRLEFAPDLPPVVTDGERLRRALVNVLTNARHAVNALAANGPGDAIRVRTARNGGRLIIEVRDRGIGIAESDLPRVFDPYFTTRRAGTGLGLAISRNIVEGLGGRIAVRSRQGQGTEVRIELPVDAGSPAVTG